MSTSSLAWLPLANRKDVHLYGHLSYLNRHVSMYHRKGTVQSETGGSADSNCNCTFFVSVDAVLRLPWSPLPSQFSFSFTFCPCGHHRPSSSGPIPSLPVNTGRGVPNYPDRSSRAKVLDAHRGREICSHCRHRRTSQVDLHDAGSGGEISWTPD